MSNFDDAPRYDAATEVEFREQGYWTDDTLETVLAKWSSSEPGRVAIIHGPAWITGGDGRVLEAGAESELGMHGYSVTPGYLRNESANATSFGPDGWYRTGDLAIIDDGGNVYITGRDQDIINRGSIKINSTDVESILASHPAIVLAAIVPMPDEALGERGCLFATLLPGATLDLAAVTAFLADNDVAKLQWPGHLVVVEDMPMTPTKKIIKSELQKMVGEVWFSARA